MQITVTASENTPAGSAVEVRMGVHTVNITVMNNDLRATMLDLTHGEMVALVKTANAALRAYNRAIRDEE